MHVVCCMVEGYYAYIRMKENIGKCGLSNTKTIVSYIVPWCVAKKLPVPIYELMKWVCHV